MATLVQESFDGLADETLISTANTAYDAVTGSILRADTARSVDGNVSMRCDGGGTGAAGASFAAQSTVKHRFYLWLDALPTGDHLFFWGMGTSSTTDVEMRVRTNGPIQLRTNSIARATSSANAPTGQWLRFDVESDGTTLIVDYFTDHLSLTPTETWTTTTSVPASIETYSLGSKSGTPTVTAWFDRDEFTDGSDPAAPPSTGGGDTTDPVADIAVTARRTVDDGTGTITGWEVDLDGTGSTDDTSVTGYAWSAPTGSFSSTTSATTTYTSAGVADETVTLTVSDAAGNTGTATYDGGPLPTVAATPKAMPGGLLVPR